MIADEDGKPFEPIQFTTTVDRSHPITVNPIKSHQAPELFIPKRWLIPCMMLIASYNLKTHD